MSCQKLYTYIKYVEITCWFLQALSIPTFKKFILKNAGKPAFFNTNF